MKTYLQKFGLLTLALSAGSAFAGYGTSLMQTAPVKDPGEHEVKFQADIIFNRGGGFNLSPHFVTGVIEHFVDVDVFVGTGTTNFQTGFLAKYNLLPDVQGQVALSFLAGLSFIRDKVGDRNINSGLMNFSVLSSKKLAATFGDVTPYGALQFEPVFAHNDSILPITALIGAKWEPSTTVPWALYSEFSFPLRRSLYALSLGASYPF